MPSTESLDTYFLNDTVPVIFEGSEPFRGIVDDYDQVVLDGQMESGSTARINAVTVKTSDVPGIENGAEITVDGVVRSVVKRLAIHDGLLTHLQLGE